MPPPPPPPPLRAQPNGAPQPPPPPPAQNRASSTQPGFTSAPPPPASPAYEYEYPKPKSYEPYGEIQTTTSGIAHRRSTDGQYQTTASTFAYGVGTPSSYVVAPSSYGTPKPPPQQEKGLSATAEARQYSHNTASLFFLLPTLASILWWHESPVIIQIFLFVVLFLYGLDLINARDAMAVAIWIAALVLTMASGFGTLLQVDDADADGSTMILFLARLAVEGMLFCSMVSDMRFITLFLETFQLRLLTFEITHSPVGVHFNSIGWTKTSPQLQQAWKSLYIHSFHQCRRRFFPIISLGC